MTTKAKGGAGDIKALKTLFPQNTDAELQQSFRENHSDFDSTVEALSRRDSWTSKPKRDPKASKKVEPRPAADQAAAAPGGRGGAARGRGGAPGGRGAGRGREGPGFEGGRPGRGSARPASGAPRPRDPPAQQPTQPAATKPSGGGGVVNVNAPPRGTAWADGCPSFTDILTQSSGGNAKTPDSTPVYPESAWASRGATTSTDAVVNPPEPETGADVTDGWGAVDSPPEEAPAEVMAAAPAEEEIVQDSGLAEAPVAPQSQAVASHQPSPYRPSGHMHQDAPAPAAESRQTRRYQPNRAAGPDVVLPAAVAQWEGKVEGNISFGFTSSSGAAPDLSDGLTDSSAMPQANSSTPSGTPTSLAPQLAPMSMLPGGDALSLMPPSQNPAGNSMPASNGTSAQSRPQNMPPSQPQQGHHSHIQQPHQTMPPHQSQPAGPPRQQHGHQQNRPPVSQGQGSYPPGSAAGQGQGQGMPGMMPEYGGYEFDPTGMGQFGQSNNGSQMPGVSDYNQFGGGPVPGNMAGFQQYGAPQGGNRQQGKNFSHNDPMGKQGMNPPPPQHGHAPNMQGGQQSGMPNQAYPNMHPQYYGHMGYPHMMGYPQAPFNHQVARGAYAGYGGYPQYDAYGAGYGGAYGGDEKMSGNFGYGGGASGQDPSSPGGKGFGGGSSGGSSTAGKNQAPSSSPAKQEMQAFPTSAFYQQTPPTFPQQYPSQN